MKEQGVGCVWILFRPNETAAGVGFDTYVDVGSGSDVRGNLTRPEKNPHTSHTLLRHVASTAAISGNGI
jgi:hypothetical protein